MRKLSELKNEEGIIVIGKILSPIGKLLSGGERKEKENNLEYFGRMLQSNPKEALEIMAALDGVPIEEYNVSLVEILHNLNEMINDPDLADLFNSQRQTIASSASAPVNTEAKM